MAEKQEAKPKPRAIRTIADLTSTPEKENPRVRTPRNRKVIEHSLRQLGAGRSILADEDGKIIAGNGTAEAAAKVGITKVRVVPTDGNELIVVQRSNLTEKQKREMAVADNRSSELAEWSPDLDALSEGVDLEPYFTAAELDGIAGDAVSSFQEMDLKPAPNMIWILAGIEVNDYGAVLEHVQAIEANARIVVKTTRDAKN
jgi:hypothetical protein